MKLMIRAHDLGVRGEDDIVKALCELGLDGIQLVAYKVIDGVEYKVGSLDAKRAREISASLHKAGKEIALIGAYFNPVHPNAEKTQHGMAVFCDYLSLSTDLGIDVVGSETGSYMGDPWGYHEMNRTDEARDRAVSVFTSLADYAKGVGARIAIEGAFNHVAYTPLRLKEIITLIDRDNVEVIFDLYNYLDISNYERAYEILDEAHELFGGDILLYHLKDFTVADGRLAQCGVGKGVVDFERILSSVYSYNKDAVLVLEGTVGEDVKYSVDYLREIIDRISDTNK